MIDKVKIVSNNDNTYILTAHLEVESWVNKEGGVTVKNKLFNIYGDGRDIVDAMIEFEDNLIQMYKRYKDVSVNNLSKDGIEYQKNLKLYFERND